MLGLALRTLRFRIGGFAASFIALFLGAAIVMACGGLMESGIRNAVAPQRLANAPLLVSGDPSYLERPPVAESLAAAVDVPGVAKVVPDVSIPVALPGGDATGHLWSALELTPYRVDTGRGPERTGEVVLDAKSGAAVGREITLGIAGKNRDFVVVGLLSGPVDAPAAYFSDDEGRRLYAKPGKVDLFGVLLEPGASADTVRDELAGAIGGRGAVVLAGDERGLAEFPDARGGGEGVITLAAVFGGLAIMVAMFVVAGTLGLSVQQRHREMALLRAIGSTPGQLRRLVLGETAVVAVLATLLGWPLSGYLGRWLLTQLGGAGVAPTQLAFRQGWVPIAAGAAISMLSALVAAFVAGRGAAVTKPTEALMEASLQSRWFSVPRLVFALVCLGGGVALSVITALVMSGPVAASTAGPTAMLWASGIALLSPAAATVIIALLRWPVRALGGLAGYLAVLNAGARRVRVAGAITPVMLATGLATALIYLQTTQAGGGGGGFAENLRADAVLGSSSGSLPAEVVAEASALPGVEAASALVDTEGYFADHGDDDDEITVLGVTPGAVEQTLAVTVTAGSVADLRGDAVVLPGKWADELGAAVGDTVKMRLSDGQFVQVKLVAVHDGPYESALMPVDLVLKHAKGGQISWVLVKGGTDALTSLTDKYPNLRVQDPSEASAGGSGGGGEQTGAWVNYLLVGMILAYTVISLVNTLVIATGERRREFALQRLIGATHGQILRMVGVEAVVVSLGGILLGGIVSLVTLVPFALAMDGSWWPSGPIGIYLTIVGAVSGLTLLSTLLSTAYVLRTPPVEAAATLS
ncbi:FtsX-like permease family protein [Actinosynnema sp. NPDC047251]|uniref:ABC-type transport system n=1 Tax=Saccharothrix espanaensis (strain ATCC 51144 / DSM 44229 / JCM 9112 / NBRC 15066 / NRRL 15764) TaxID=1179773 RepID=K0JZ52_SACES|nr:FtsX-like permease family protein [Saccharothrix espanaensis]CCH30537.1 ABC-type transport system [Saccharothrix espanaensis DSM 44229]